MEIIRRSKNKIRSIIKEIQEHNRFKRNVHLVKQLAQGKKSNRKIIIDCGFNQGIVAEMLLRALDDFCLRGFEIQQDIKEYFLNLKRKYSDRDIDVLYCAIADRNGEIEYFEPKTWGKNYKGGTTTVKNKKNMLVEGCILRVTPCIDFSEWLYKNFTKEDFIFVKMDIEGAEYDVIEHLIKTNALDLIDVIAVEWHAEKFEEPQATRYREIEAEVKKYGKEHMITVLDWY